MATYKRYRLTITLPIVIISFTAVLTLGIVTLNYFSTSRALQALAYDQLKNVNQQVIAQLVGYFSPSASIVRHNEFLIGQYEAPLTQVQKNDLEKNFVNQLSVFPQLARICYGDEKGHFISALRDKNKNQFQCKSIWKKENTSLTFIRIIECDAQGKAIGDEKVSGDSEDPRNAFWYQAAKDQNELICTKIYRFPSSQKLGITLAYPHRINNRIQGVVGVDVYLDTIAETIENTKIAQHGIGFMMDQAGKIVALPKGAMPNKNVSNSRHLISEANSPSIRAAYAQLKKHNQRIDKQQKVKFSVAGKSYYGIFTPMANALSLDWVIGIIVPEDDFLGSVKESLSLTLLLTLWILAASLVFCSIFVKQITKTLARLTQSTKKIHAFELDTPVNIKSRFVELDAFSQAFEAMRLSLKSFQKYVPATLVHELIDTGEEAAIGGQERPLSIFFSDIAGFTSISETMSATDLTQHLNQYLSEMSEVIYAHQGTIDKFIGDAVMAFWNAPRQNDRHPVLSCLAALAYQEKLASLRKTWGKEGKPAFYSRIGIHTDDVIVGNIGAASRMDYTIIGDGVNLASRLESLCKFYNVEIIIGDNTKNALDKETQTTFITRTLDRVTVVGKTHGVSIYELIGIADDLQRTNPAKIKQAAVFNQAMEAYFNQDWQAAKELLLTISSETPDDTPTKIILERIAKFQKTPPEQPWLGIYNHLAK